MQRKKEIDLVRLNTKIYIRKKKEKIFFLKITKKAAKCYL